MKNISTEANRWIQSVGGGVEKTYISAELEHQLIDTIQHTGNEAETKTAKQELLAWNAAYIASIALEVQNSIRGAEKIPIVDIIQEGLIRFYERVETFDTTRETRLTTWYTRDVKTVMQRFVFDHAYTVRQGSVYLQTVASQALTFIEEYRQVHDDTPSVDRIAEHTGHSENSITDALEYTKIHTDPIPAVYGSALEPDGSPLDTIFSMLERKLHDLDLSERKLVLISMEKAIELPPALQMKLKQL